MSNYKRTDYDPIFKKLLQILGKKSYEVSNQVWIYWHKQVAYLFDQGITIAEVLGAMDEACNKMYWPAEHRFWSRVNDVALKNRRERPSTTKRDEGFQSIDQALWRYVDNPT